MKYNKLTNCAWGYKVLDTWKGMVICMLRKIPRKYFEIFDFINKRIKKKDKNIFIYSNLGFRDNIKAIYDFFINDSRLATTRLYVV